MRRLEVNHSLTILIDLQIDIFFLLKREKQWCPTIILLYVQVHSVKKKGKEVILRAGFEPATYGCLLPLQSTALPTELSKENSVCKTNCYTTFSYMYMYSPTPVIRTLNYPVSINLRLTWIQKQVVTTVSTCTTNVS